MFWDPVESGRGRGLCSKSQRVAALTFLPKTKRVLSEEP